MRVIDLRPYDLTLDVKLNDFTHNDFTLSLDFIERDVEIAGQSYMDWLSCQINVRVSPFWGQLGWSVMPKELIDLADGLERLRASLDVGGSYSFEPSDQNFRLNIIIGTGGAIYGHCEFKRGDLGEDVLIDTFWGDQSYIPSVVQEIRDIVHIAKNIT